MIRIILGAVGSGKTALSVRGMYKNPLRRKTYTNIKTSLKHIVPITPEMIVKKEITGYKKSRATGESEPIIKRTLNVEFWKSIKEPINVTIDEAHTVLNARRSMSKENIIMSDWLALIRRVLGETKDGNGTLTLITQLPRRLDSIAREMATNITYCVMHYLRTCNNCGVSWQENSEIPEETLICFSCQSLSLKKHGHTIEVWEFTSMIDCELWKDSGRKTFYKHYFVKDITDYFTLYNTLQWDNLFSDFYY